MNRDDVEGAVCQDCALIIANDDDSGVSDAAAHRERMAANAPRGHAVVTCDGEDEHETFARTACTACGSTLAGDRCPTTWIGGTR